jgi:myo-inositol catabolism protein IolS
MAVQDHELIPLHADLRYAPRMRYRTIGATGIKVSEIGFGCWTMGGPNWSTSNGQAIGWADVNDDEIVAGIKAGLDGGVNHWDNADIYGNGRAERSLAAAFRKLGIQRDTQVIATKVGHFRGTAPYAFEPRHIRNQCEQSLLNLGTDYIDIYYFHHGTYVGPGYDGQPHDYLHEAAAVMHELVKAGKVRAIGQSAYSDEDFERAVPVLKPHVLQNKANLRYDDFIRPGSRCQALMQKHNCTFVAFGPLDQGILLDKFDPDNPPKFDEGDYRQGRKDFNRETLRGVRSKLAQMKQRFKAGANDATEVLSSASCRWVLAHDHVCSVIPGFRNARQAACNLRGAADAPMSADDVAWCRGLFSAT